MSTFGSFALRSGTLHSYATQTRALERLATSYGIDLSKPLSELDLCILISVYATTHKVTSLTTFVSAVAHDARRRFGQDATLPRHGLYRQTRAGIEKFYGDTATPTPKALVYLDDLCTFARLLPRHTFEGARDGCACLLAFYGLLRIREYMDAGLRICDVLRCLRPRHGRHVQQDVPGADDFVSRRPRRRAVPIPGTRSVLRSLLFHGPSSSPRRRPVHLLLQRRASTDDGRRVHHRVRQLYS